MFGSSSLLVRAPDAAALHALVAKLEGQLTIALHIDVGDHADAAALLPILEEKAGRILVNGYGTGVEVSDAMVHGGPFPATSDSRTTLVGTLAIQRFLRPVSYQDLPQGLLAEALRDGNPLGINRMVDGTIGKGVVRGTPPAPALSKGIQGASPLAGPGQSPGLLLNLAHHPGCYAEGELRAESPWNLGPVRAIFRT